MRFSLQRTSGSKLQGYKPTWLFRPHWLLLAKSLVAVVSLFAFPSCVLLQSHVGCCKFHGDFQKTDQRLVGTETPKDAEFKFGCHHRDVFVAHAHDAWRDAPPILLLHEMPGLSPDTLELAHCLTLHGYTVYVPLLFGRLGENTDSVSVFLHQVADLEGDADWKGAFKVATRPNVLDSIEDLARKILRRHHTQRLGVIGLCVTGNMPLALAAEMPEVVAPVASQPAAPFYLVSPTKAKDAGLTNAEIQHLRARIHQGLQILGFRFEYDHVCPPQRFAALRMDFGTHGFLDRTLKGSRYEKIDGLPHGAHAVLTTCYQPWHCQLYEPATHYAYRQLLAFLSAKLMHPGEKEYQDPPPLSHSDDLPCDSARGRCGKHPKP